MIAQIDQIIRSAAELLKDIGWPGVVLTAIWILRRELAALTKRITKLQIGHKDTTAVIELAKELETTERVVSDAAKQEVQKVVTASIQAKSTSEAVIQPRFLDPSEIKALRDALGIDLEVLERLSKGAATGPSIVIEQSWNIVEADVVKTAKVLGGKPIEGAGSELKQALFYLTTKVLSSQNLMIAVYGLNAAREKVRTNPSAEVKPEDAERFATNAMAIIAELGLQLEKAIRPPNQG